jgi:hypothetical protein
MISITIGVNGLNELLRDAKLGFHVPEAVELGIKRASVFVEGAAKRRVHRQSRKLQASTGHNIEGSGLDTRGVVGPQPGFGAPRTYTAQSQRVEIGGYAFTDKSRRKVKRTNRGDPTVYGYWEEYGNRYREGHPWLVPSLMENEERITELVNAEVRKVLRRVGKQR